MNLLLKIFLPLLILLGGVVTARQIAQNAPEAVQRPQSQTRLTVEARTLNPQVYTLRLQSQGSVQPARANALVSDIAGTVAELSADFEVGSRFKAGDTLLRLDPRDYQLALAQADAAVAQAAATLQRERAEAELAQADWESLGRLGQPSALTLRKPQIAAARANLAAAQAQRERAQLDLDRTTVKAPYDGRVLERNVDSGQYVNRGSGVGRIYADDAVDIRLPLSEREFAQLPLERIGIDNADAPTVQFSTADGRSDAYWQGRVVRVEGLDEATQQVHVVARVDAPFADVVNPLRIGQFVQAQVEARRLEDVFVMPRSALRDESTVLLLEAGERVKVRTVDPLWSDGEQIIVEQGLAGGEVLITTPMSTYSDGMTVRAIVDGRTPEAKQGPPARGGRVGGGD